MTTVSIECDEVTAGYLPGVRGHAVLAFGPAADGGDALAVWRLDPSAIAGGAWIVPAADIHLGSEPFTSIIAMLDGRALVDWGDGQSERALRAIAAALPAQTHDRLTAAIAPIPDLLKEIGDLRQEYEDALDRHRTQNSSQVQPLAWTEPVPGDAETARAALTPARWMSPSSAGEMALSVAGGMRRAVELWEDTESVRCRRSYLRSLGRPQMLPPQWTARLRALAGFGGR